MNSKTVTTIILALACALFATPSWGCNPFQSGSRNSGGSSSRSGSTPANNFPSGNFSSNPPASNFGGSVPGNNFSPAPASGNYQPNGPRQGSSASSSGNSSSGSIGIPAAEIDDDIWTIHDPNSILGIDHTIWNYFLARYVVTDRQGLNRVAYRCVSCQDRQLLKQYLSQLQAVDVRTLNRSEQLAYWVNLYNSKTVSLVLDHYPLRSIRRIKTHFFDLVGPFDDDVLTVLGKPLSLTTIESGILRPIWKDPRIHYALNCASFGCPNLSKTAWSPVDMDSRLNQAAYDFLNSGRGIKTRFFGRRVVASKIFKWYKDDFGGDDQQVLEHIRSYANPNLQCQLSHATKINRFFYDWSLNDARVRRRRIFEPFRR